MERRLIETIVNGIIRQRIEHDSLVLDAIALYICRENRKDIRLRLNTKQFDFENLFADGTYLIKKMISFVPKEQLSKLAENFVVTSEVLLDYAISLAPKQFSQQGSIKEGASNLLVRYLAPKSGNRIYNPFGGDCYAPLKMSSSFFVSEVMGMKENRYMQLVLAAKGIENVHTRIANPFMRFEGEPEHNDLIYIPAMPFGVRITGMGRKIEQDFVLRMLDTLKPNGRLVVVLPEIFLSADTYYELRKTIVEKRWLRDVIFFKEKSVYYTTNIRVVGIVIEKSESDSNTFQLVDTTSYNLDLESDFINLVDKISFHDEEVVSDEEYSSVLASSIAQIFDSNARESRIARPGYKYVKLKEILAPFAHSVELDGEQMVPRLSGKDMHLELPSYMIDIQDVEITNIRGRFTCINKPVFCFHGITQNFLWCHAEDGYEIYCNSDVYTFTIKDERISPEYLCFIMHEEDILADIKSRVAGSTIPRITRSSLLDVEIPIPDENRRALFEQEILRYISECKSRLAKVEQEHHQETIEDIKDDIEDKIHLMGPYNLDIQSGLNRVLKKLENGETLEASTKIFKKSDITLADYLRQLVTKSLSAGYITASIGGNIFEPVARPMDSFIYLQEYVAYLQSDNAYKGITFSLGPIAAPYALMITPRTMNLVLDTIVRNAVMHGFSDSFYGDKRIWINITEDTASNEAIISVANNGLPADEAFSEDLYERKFGKCGETQHTGRGGYFVSNAMKFYKGRVSVDTTNKEWPFIVKLHIPMSHE